MAITKISDTGSLSAAAPHNMPPRDNPNFDSLAKVYRWIEYLSFGPMLERCRFHFLEECAGARHALVLGDGDGRFITRLLATNPNVRIDAVDSSAAMLSELQRRASHKVVDAEIRLRTHHADLRNFAPDRGGYDLVASHFLLDCLTDNEVASMVEQVIPRLTPNATWLISEFAIPEEGWRRVAARVIVRFLYFAFDRMTHLRVRKIPDYGQCLARYGFQRRKQVRLLGGLLVAERWQQHDR